MPRINVDVDIDIEDYLDEIDTRDLIEALSYKNLSVKEKGDLFDLTKEKRDPQININSLIDEIKLEVILKGLQKKTLEEIESFFKQ
jgi:hypothetical protein